MAVVKNKSNNNSSSLLLFLFFLFLAASALRCDAQGGSPLIWPQPSSFSNGSLTGVLAAEFFFSEVGLQTSTIQQAFARYSSLIFSHNRTLLFAQPLYFGPEAPPDQGKEAFEPANPVFVGLEVYVSNSSESYPQLDTDESYSLTIDSNSSTTNIAVLRAATVYGALRGLETFSQLVLYDFDNQFYTIPACPWSIEDAPRFNFRGLMLDTSRHYYSLPVILETLDAMAYSKLNVLHWHGVDDQSFPMQVPSFPYLWNASYTPYFRYSMGDILYTQEYARLRGIRLLVEFDNPGHAESWCVGYPDVCPSMSCQTPLNVANNFTFEVIEGILNDYTKALEYEFFHLGGDEVDTSCWTSTPSIASWLEKQNMTATEAYGYFVMRSASLARAAGRTPVQWVEVFDNFGPLLDKDTIIHVWKSKSDLQSVVQAGFRAILSDIDNWYLTGPHIDLPWQTYYLNEPLEGIPSASQPLVIGGETCAWSETLDTASVHGTIWPRAAAVAERLWSPMGVNSTAEALPRLLYFRCLLNNRGIPASPLLNSVADTPPPQPGSCLFQ